MLNTFENLHLKCPPWHPLLQTSKYTNAFSEVSSNLKV